MDTFTDWDTEREETFDFLGIKFDVREAKRILKARPRANRLLEVHKYEALLEMISGFSPASRIDLDVPVICLAVGKGSFPIDGWNRILEATRQRRATLPCVRLNEAEQALIKMTC
jgi:hypothetical protein